MKKPHMGPKELQTILQDTHKVTISYDVVWHGKEKALKELFGTWEDSFRQLYSWKEAVLEKLPDSVIEIDTCMEDGRLYFSRFFCALGPCITGFLDGCRPYLSVDSTALNGRWNGHLPSATSIDGQNWMFPVAFGFFESETLENWQWFMTQLKKAVGDLPVLAVCSDACKGLMGAVNRVFPNTEKRECFRHLMQNYIKHHAGSEYMYPAAMAYRKEIYEHHIAPLRAVPVIARYLEKDHPFLWYRSGYNPAIKCDYLTNNIAEVFNNWIKDYKDLPVCDLAEKIREMIMVLFHRRRIGKKYPGKILPLVIHRLKAQTRGLGHLSIVKCDDYVAEVGDNNDCLSKHIVDVEVMTCTCLEWQHTGKPCQHALCVIITQDSRDVGMEDFVHEYYSIERFQKAYVRRVLQVGPKSFWPKVEFAKDVGSPLGKRAVGRQRKNRIKSCLEGGSGKKPQKTGKILIRGPCKCPNCGVLGHRKNSPKCSLNGTKKRQEPNTYP